jgi:hypothetical protein
MYFLFNPIPEAPPSNTDMGIQNALPSYPVSLTYHLV